MEKCAANTFSQQYKANAKSVVGGCPEIQNVTAEHLSMDDNFAIDLLTLFFFK